MKRVFVAAVAIALSSAQTPTPQPAGRVSEASVVRALLKQFNVPGVSIAIIKDFKVAATHAYGVADIETGAPVTPETMFQAASISKPVAAMASLKAVQNGTFT